MICKAFMGAFCLMCTARYSDEQYTGIETGIAGFGPTASVSRRRDEKALTNGKAFIAYQQGKLP